MRKIFLFVALFLSLLFSTSIDNKIKRKKRQLYAKDIEYNKMDKKLSSLASKIIELKEQSITLDNKLSQSKRNMRKNQQKFNELNKKKKLLDKEISELNKNIEAKREKFIELVADKFSMALVLEEIKKPTPKSIILQETYKIYAKENEKKIENLKKDIERLNQKESYLLSQQENLQEKIRVYKTKIQEYKAQKAKKTELIAELARDKAIYKKRFDKIRASRRALQRKLAKLKIIKQDREYEGRTIVREQKKYNRYNQYNSNRYNDTSYDSYDTIETEPIRRVVVSNNNYYGGKTISPLSGSRLIKKFGVYIDPIYKFKIFNKSITLKAPYQGARVKSVLSGKVVFAENSGGMLGKVVIIAHPNNLHTIYAKLSRLAPGIHVGKRVSKGSTIGKVNSILMFEVTKNNKHMNPLKLIRL